MTADLPFPNSNTFVVGCGHDSSVIINKSDRIYGTQMSKNQKTYEVHYSMRSRQFSSMANLGFAFLLYLSSIKDLKKSGGGGQQQREIMPLVLHLASRAVKYFGKLNFCGYNR